MRTREKIQKDSEELIVSYETELVIELLLDIRDLLAERNRLSDKLTPTSDE